jgi:hypothetical protein
LVLSMQRRAISREIKPASCPAKISVRHT